MNKHIDFYDWLAKIWKWSVPCWVWRRSNYVDFVFMHSNALKRR